MHRSGSTCGVNRRRRCIRKRKSRERLCCGYTGSRLINNELFFVVEDHGSRVGNLGDLCRSSREVGNVLLLHRAINGLHEVALRFTSLWWLLSAVARSAACSLSIVAVVVVVVGTVSCIFTAFAPCVPGTRVNRARSIIRNADTGGSTGGVFTPSLGSLSLSLSLGRRAPIFRTYGGDDGEAVVLAVGHQPHRLFFFFVRPIGFVVRCSHPRAVSLKLLVDQSKFIAIANLPWELCGLLLPTVLSRHLAYDRDRLA